MSYETVILQEFPPETQVSMLRFAEAFEQSLRRAQAEHDTDRDSLRADIGEILEGQKRGDQRMERLEKAMESLFDVQKDTIQSLQGLAEAQNRTEKRVGELAESQNRTEKRVEELAQAQNRTEKRVEELAEAQNRTEKRVEELAEAQNRTELRVGKLAEAQNRTELRIGKLAEAQEVTEHKLQNLIETVDKLSEDQRDTRRQLGGLSMTVGYRLEDLAYPALPKLLLQDFDITVLESLERRYVHDNRGKLREIDILGKAERDGKSLTIIGEAKAQLSKNDVDRFLKRTLGRLTDVYDTIFPVLVTYMISEPDVEEYAREHDIALYYSYNF